jgi:signal transduction histidine kinase
MKADTILAARRVVVARGNPGPGGYGLGLAIVSAIAVAHGADVSARPRPEGGLDVTVTCPAGPDRSL